MIKQLTLQEVKNEYGKFKYWPWPKHRGWILPDPYWVAKHIRYCEVPLFGRLVCHEQIISDLYQIGRVLMRSGIKVNMKWGGCYTPRHICHNPTKGLSRHAWGTALDFNVQDNPFGSQPKMDIITVEVFKMYAWIWGGTFRTPDGMHFEKGKRV